MKDIVIILLSYIGVSETLPARNFATSVAAALLAFGGTETRVYR